MMRNMISGGKRRVRFIGCKREIDQNCRVQTIWRLMKQWGSHKYTVAPVLKIRLPSADVLWSRPPISQVYLGVLAAKVTGHRMFGGESTIRHTRHYIQSGTTPYVLT